MNKKIIKIKIRSVCKMGQSIKEIRDRLNE